MTRIDAYAKHAEVGHLRHDLIGDQLIRKMPRVRVRCNPLLRRRRETARVSCRESRHRAIRSVSSPPAMSSTNEARASATLPLWRNAQHSRIGGKFRGSILQL